MLSNSLLVLLLMLLMLLMLVTNRNILKSGIKATTRHCNALNGLCLAHLGTKGWHLGWYLGTKGLPNAP